jgi:TolB-like protein/tetratricopeptide (TPR) repeat protein/tRNA A-37 threonylcarbamoyl transferase component Bud32
MADLKEGLQQTLGSAFTVERELSGGGMSRVFVALDASLGRRVVVKVLPPELAASVSVDRFKREILLAATLQHPHIVGVLTAGDIAADEYAEVSTRVPYFTMPFVEGESLRVRIDREGRLTVGRTVSILRDVARALEHAHARGVVHRDIKPDNVLLSGTSAQVTDFGIAKAVLSALGSPSDESLKAESRDPRAASKSSSVLTALGTTLGTPAYMAPEQAAADATTDHRADIYSFGIMAYEMLTGRVPFKSKTPQALLAAQLTATPQPIPLLRDDVPVALAAFVMSCLEKEREKRPQSAAQIVSLLEHPDMVSGAFASAPMPAVKRRNRTLVGTLAAAAALAFVVFGALWWRKLTSEPPAPPPPASALAAGERARSIVVLPFVNIGRDTTDAYLADGLTNDLINALGRVEGIRVTSRSVASSAREKFTSATDVGKALNVGRILEGTVQREGNRLRVTARVTNTDDGFMLWSDMFERELKDVFAVQDEISGAIATALGAQMAPDSVAIAAVNDRGTTNDAAYDLYLRGRHFFEKRGEAALRRALDLFRESAQQDPRFARAHAGVAGVYSVLPLYSRVTDDSIFDRGFAAATRAIQLDTALADAYASRAVLLNSRWRWREAERDLQRAIALDPDYASAHHWYGEQLALRNRIPEALNELKRAAELDPVSPVVASAYGIALVLAKRDAEAVAQARRGIEMDSTLFVPRLVLGFAHIAANRPADAIRELEPALGLGPNSYIVQGLLGYAYAVGGQRANADAMAEQLAAQSDANAQGALAVVMMGLGDTSRALTHLENAARAHASIFTAHPLGASVFDPVRANPRFQAVLRTVGVQ